MSVEEKGTETATILLDTPQVPFQNNILIDSWHLRLSHNYYKEVAAGFLEAGERKQVFKKRRYFLGTNFCLIVCYQ